MEQNQEDWQRKVEYYPVQEIEQDCHRKLAKHCNKMSQKNSFIACLVHMLGLQMVIRVSHFAVRNFRVLGSHKEVNYLVSLIHRKEAAAVEIVNFI